MVKEPKGFLNNSGQRLKRDIPLSTRTGIVIYKGKGDAWYLNYPNMTERIECNTIKLMTLIYHLGHGKNLDRSRELSGL